MVEKYCNVIFYFIQGQDLKAIKCKGRTKFVNEFLFSDQCVHRLLFGFVRSCLLFNLLVNVVVKVEKFLQRLMCIPPDSRRNIVIMNLLFLSQNKSKNGKNDQKYQFQFPWDGNVKSISFYSVGKQTPCMLYILCIR